MSLRAKLIILFSCMLAILFALTGYVLWQSERAVRDEAGRMYSLVAYQISGRLTENIHAKIDLLESFSWTPGVDQYLQQTLALDLQELGVSSISDPELAALRKRTEDEMRRRFISYFEATHGHRVFEQVFLLDLQGRMVATVGTQDEEAEALYAEISEELSQDRYYVSSFRKRKEVVPAGADDNRHAHNHTGIYMAAHIKNVWGEQRGIIVGFLPASALFEQIDFSLQGKVTTRVELISREGQVLFASHAFRFKEDATGQGVFKRLQEKSGWFEFQSDSGEEMIAYEYLRDKLPFQIPGWFLIVRSSMSDVIGESRALLSHVFWAGLVVIAFICLCILYLLDEILGPMQKLRDDMERVGKGQLSHRARGYTTTEFQHLANGFNAMVVRVEEASARLESQIRQRVDAELALQSQYHFLEALFDTLPSPIFYKDTDGRYSGCNKAFETLIGKSRDEIINMTPFDLFTPENARILVRKDQELYETGGTQIFESHLYDNKGTLHTLVFNKTLFRTASGEVAGLIGVLVDISDRKAVEDALRQAQSRFDLIASTIRDVFWIRDFETGAFIYVNEGAKKTWGLQVETLLANATVLKQRVVSQDVPLVEEAWKALALDDQYSILYRVHRDDGQIGWVRERAYLVRGMPGEPTHAVGISQDCTAQQQAALQIRRSEERYRILVESIPQRIYVKDRSMNYVSCNRAFATALGHRQEDVPGASDFDLYPPALAQQYRQEDDEVIQSDRVHESEFKQLLLGQERWISSIKAPVRDEDGSLIGMLGVEWDITEKKQGEAELQRYRAHLEELVAERTGALQHLNENLRHEIEERTRLEAAARTERDRAQQYLDIAGVMILVLDDQGRVRLINRRGCEILQRPENEILGLDWCDTFVPLEAQAIVSDVFRKNMIGDIQLQAEVVHEVVTASGDRKRIRWYNALIRDENARIIGTISSGTDITAQYAAEQALQEQTQELERSNNELAQFAYIASHDLQEPLRTMASYIGMIERRYTDLLDERGLKYMQYVVGGCERLQRMVRGLLGLSRVGTAQLDCRRIDTTALVQNIIVDLRESIADAGAEVVVEDLPAVYADEDQITVVFQNLIANAIKFRGDEALRVDVQGTRSATETLFTVRDTGIGIPPEYAEKIFRVFQRLHTMDEYPGTGIGLSVCRRVLERHGGRIWVESDGQSGSTFCFAIPRTGEEDDE